MEKTKTQLDEYLEKTGQSMQDLMAGASQYGMSFILDELVPKALEQEKKIVWKDTDIKLGLSEYSFEDI